MANAPTREQYIRKAKSIRRAGVLIYRFRRLVLRKRPAGKEIFIDTAFGRVRTLWYGVDTSAPAPLYIDLHGGGFILGSADMDEPMNLELHKQVGCKIVSIQYAKAPDHPYPAAVNQVYAVVQHIVANADKYGIDPRKMAIGGHSAGANLATVTCLKAKQDGKFQFVLQVLDYPPLDLATDPFAKPQPKGAIAPQMAAMFNACYVDPAQAKDPYVSPLFAPALGGLPPVLIIVAGGDSLHDEGLHYVELLRAAGVVTECHDYPGAPHGFTYRPSADTTDAVAKIAAALKHYLC